MGIKMYSIKKITLERNSADTEPKTEELASAFTLNEALKRTQEDEREYDKTYYYKIEKNKVVATINYD